jgi:hydrogenase maturation factor HypF (carbamoyltransferase family)
VVHGHVCRIPAADRTAIRQYWVITLEGALRAVGFRAFVQRLACEEGLGGDVRHTSHGVVIQVHGSPAILGRFHERLGSETPSPMKIDACEVKHVGEGAGWIREFRVIEDVPAPVRLQRDPRT